MTYAEHQEATSSALVRLLHRANQPLAPGDVDAVLECRRHALTSLRERIGDLGHSEPYRQPKNTDRTIDAARYPLHVLSRVLQELDRAHPAIKRPSSILAGPPVDQSATTTELWKAVARHLFLGNADLTSATRQPWQDGNAAAWYLVGDTAHTIEAIIVLDQSPALAGHQERDRTPVYVEQRLAIGDVSRLASWYGTDTSPDLAFAAARTTLGINGNPRIHLVRKAEDFALAQRALASLMRPRTLAEDAAHPEHRPGLLAARTIATGQVRLADAFACWAEKQGDVHLADQFRDRIPRYLELHHSSLRLTELQRSPSHLVVAQQSEMIQQLRRHQSPRPSTASLHDLNDATHELTINVGKTLRREGMRRKNILILDTERIGLPGARPITNTRERFNVACGQLAKEPAFDSRGASPAGSRSSRDQLTRSLDERPPVRPPVVRRPPLRAGL